MVNPLRTVEEINDLTSNMLDCFNNLVKEKKDATAKVVRNLVVGIPVDNSIHKCYEAWSE
jgi:hypothetical protein